MRILIPGGFGFIGGRLAQNLSAAGHKIVLGTSRQSQISDWLPGAEVAQINWDDTHSLKQICDGIDMVIHAAGMNMGDCAAYPTGALEFNGLATSRLVSAAVEAGVKRFFYLSTAHVYDSPLLGSIEEESCPRNLHPYATSHLAGESALRYAVERKQIVGFVLRLSNAFGAPAQKEANCWMLLINDLCRQAVSLRSMTLRSSGLQRRDFVTLYDVVRAVSHLIELPKGEVDQGVFNVGSGRSTRVIDMVELIQSRCVHLFGYTPEIIRPQSFENEDDFSLDYRVDKLLHTGFNLNGNAEKEIDNILIMCNESFAKIT